MTISTIQIFAVLIVHLAIAAALFVGCARSRSEGSKRLPWWSWPVLGGIVLLWPLVCLGMLGVFALARLGILADLRGAP